MKFFKKIFLKSTDTGDNAVDKVAIIDPVTGEIKVSDKAPDDMGGGVNPKNVVKVNSDTTITAERPLYLEVDTNTADVTITLPQGVDKDEIYIRNKGSNNVVINCFGGELMEGLGTYTLAEGDMQHILFENRIWTTIMKETGIVTSTATYFVGFYTIIDNTKEDYGTIYADVINVASGFIDLSKYNMYFMSGDPATGTVTPTLSIEQTTTENLQLINAL